MTEEPKRSWFTTRRVIFIAGLLIGFSEITAVLSIIFWANQNFVILMAWYALAILFFNVMMLYSFAESYGYSKTLNLVKRTPDPQLTWLYIHFGYVLIGLANIMLALLPYLSLVVTRAPFTRSFEGWMFFTGATVFVVNLYSFFLLKLIGQAYEGLRGASFLGAAALARVAERTLSASKPGGIGYLQDSLAMLKALSQSWTFYASDLDRVIFTVGRLSQADYPPFGKLETLSGPLTKLPDLDDLPDAFRAFLEDQKWSRGFEPHRIKRSTFRPTYVLTFLLGILGIIVALYPTEVRNTLAALGESITNDPLILLAFTFSVISIVSGLIMMTYRVALSDIRNYGDWPLALATVASGIFWILWLIVGATQNPSLISDFWYYPGGLLIPLLGTLVKRRLQHQKKSKG